MTTPESRKEAYRACKAHPANHVDRQWLDKDGIDYDAVRQRIEFIGMIYAEPLGGFPEPCDPAEIKRLTRMTDRSLGQMRHLWPFIDKYGLSLDWLFLGDISGVLMDARHYRNRDDAERVAAMEDSEADTRH